MLISTLGAREVVTKGGVACGDALAVTTGQKSTERIRNFTRKSVEIKGHFTA